ncbi:monocarboxylate transporter 13-like [Ruditapes philippinarum]|uniref:monocarboxylate transporter 13-like n=1 Tax=Ruditapes philippinarum TaxID=129788 RepID=UPI00295B0A11|nr:monocarboxylate transporter 13-like [Ruditapes philippinarum]
MMKDKRISKTGQTDGGYGWVVVMSAFFIGFITDGLVFSVGILLVELLEQFQQGRAATVAIASIMTGVMHLVGPIVGALIDLYGCRVLVVTGAVISCVGFVISSFATGILFLCLSYGLLAGLGFGLMYIPAGVCVIRHFNKRRTLANGIAVCGSGVGTFVFNILTRKLIDEYSWRGTLLLEAGITLQGAVLGQLLLQPKFKRSNEHDHNLETLMDKIDAKSVIDTENEYTDSSGVIIRKYQKDKVTDSENICFEIKTEANYTSKTKPSSAKAISKMIPTINTILHVDLLKDYKCWLFLMSAFTFQLAFTIPFNLIPDQAIGTGMTKNQAAWLTSSIGISNTVSRILFGVIGDTRCVNRMILLEIILVLAGVSTGLSFLLTTFELKLIYTSLYGFLVGGYVTLCTVVLADLFGADLIAKSFGLLMFFIGVSGFISTPIGGLLFDLTGNYHATFVVAGGEFLIAAFLLLLLKLL